MKHNFTKFFSLLAVTFFSVAVSFSQETTPKLFSGTDGFRSWSFGLNVGGMAPISAVGGKNDFSKWRTNLGYGGYLKYQVSHSLGLQLDFLRGKLAANNGTKLAGVLPTRPMESFETDIHWSASLSGVLTLGNINWSQLHTAIQPYISLGAGAINFNPTTTASVGGAVVKFKPTGSVTEVFVPIGFGIKANLSKSVNLDIGYMMAYMDADNLDGTYLAPYLGDKFSYAHIGLEFSLGNKSKPQLARHNPPAQLYKELRDEHDAMRAKIDANEVRSVKNSSQISGIQTDVDKLKVDTDGDGVSDTFDKCPGTPGNVKVDGAGCPLPVPAPVRPSVRDTIVKENTTYVITAEDRQIITEAIRNMEFEFGKSTIRPRSYPYLNKVAEMLVQKRFSLKLGGHTDAVGSDAANMKLSKDRAEAIKDYMVSQGVNIGRIEAVGYGESQPIASNKTASGRQSNRRVEFTLY